MEDSFNRPSAIFFDVNETLLDLGPVQDAVATALGGRPDLVSLWFTTTLHYSLNETVAERFHSFQEIGRACLQMIADQQNIRLDSSSADAAFNQFTRLAPHSDVLPAMQALQKAGLTLYALTNSPSRTLQRQMENAELTGFFDKLFSVEEIGLYKPHRYVYRWAARRAGRRPEDIMMVAAHAWDIAGAQWAGLRTAFIARPGKATYSLADEPEIIQPDLIGVADYLLNLRAV